MGKDKNATIAAPKTRTPRKLKKIMAKAAAAPKG